MSARKNKDKKRKKEIGVRQDSVCDQTAVTVGGGGDLRVTSTTVSSPFCLRGQIRNVCTEVGAGGLSYKTNFFGSAKEMDKTVIFAYRQNERAAISPSLYALY